MAPGPRRGGGPTLGSALAALSLLLAAAAPANAAANATDLDGAWVAGASPAAVLTASLTATCKCAPDPLLADPSCILCLCGGATGTPSPDGGKSKVKKGCGLSDAPKAVVHYATGAVSGCVCAPDPFLNAPQWVLCECPIGKPAPQVAPVIPTAATYTAWPLPPGSRGSPPQAQWPVCEKKFALCTFANCTVAFPFKSLSGVPLAECGCIESGVGNNLTDSSLVDTTFILDKKLLDATNKQCPNGTESAKGKCAKANGTPFCKAVEKNKIYGGEYDLISLYASSPGLGGLSKLCAAEPGVAFHAECMTAACYRRRAFDGSPVSCYCPVYASTAYIIGAPAGVEPSCAQNPPYVPSGSNLPYPPS
ncbi:MAG: hypothetical protein J3K34DRAFT_418235 [Monoraphidium minutum]|nr:MAG: hypothetical protein J3K34DRAFT_418235 [Monoraphidium minutum]